MKTLEVLIASLILVNITACGGDESYESPYVPEHIYLEFGYDSEDSVQEDIEENETKDTQSSENDGRSNPNWNPPTLESDEQECFQNMNDICQAMRVLVETDQFLDRHYRWLCYGIGVERYRCH